MSNENYNLVIPSSPTPKLCKYKNVDYQLSCYGNHSWIILTHPWINTGIDYYHNDTRLTHRSRSKVGEASHIMAYGSTPCVGMPLKKWRLVKSLHEPSFFSFLSSFFINHWVLHSLLIVILALELFFSDSQALRCQYSMLYAILLE